MSASSFRAAGDWTTRTLSARDEIETERSAQHREAEPVRHDEKLRRQALEMRLRIAVQSGRERLDMQRAGMADRDARTLGKLLGELADTAAARAAAAVSDRSSADLSFRAEDLLDDTDDEDEDNPALHVKWPDDPIVRESRANDASDDDALPSYRFTPRSERVAGRDRDWPPTWRCPPGLLPTEAPRASAASRRVRARGYRAL